MAEKACRDGLARRTSFRQTLVDHAEAGLPDEYLEALEQKRKQLDESIHKYVAAKERDYRQFEKDLKQQQQQQQQRKLVGTQDGASRPTRTSFESTQDTPGTSSLRDQQSSVVDTLLAAGLRREHIGQTVALAVVDNDGPTPTLEATKATAGLIDRRVSTDRNKDFIGVFTPAFLPALDSNDESSTKRAESAPALASLEKLKRVNGDGNHRSHSDTAVDALAKRPAQLQLVQRSSSSGSSVDGKLTSALKSPTQQSRTKRKRVSLAVGDTIVAPSDNVPLSMSNNSTPSHSKTPAAVPEQNASIATTKSQTFTQPQSIDTALSSAHNHINTNETTSNNQQASKTTLPSPKPVPAAPLAAFSQTTSPMKIDPDGDFFDLQDEDSAPEMPPNEDPFESEDEVVGRIASSTESRDADELYDSNAGKVPDENHTAHVDFSSGSAVASQQPTRPGFRRPSASYDPTNKGANHERTESDAMHNDVYGSSFNRPSSKGSFTAGSLGESFMAQNAERLMRNRAREQPEVPS